MRIAAAFLIAAAFAAAEDIRIDVNTREWGSTGVITRDVALVNTTGKVQHVAPKPSGTWRLPKGEYTLTCLYGGWGQERQVATERITTGRRAFVSDRGRSTSLYAPWFYLRNETTGTGYLAQLAYSGNWELIIERHPGTGHEPLSAQELTVTLGMRADAGGTLALEPGRRFELPRVAFTEVRGDLDDAANRMHRFQRQFVFPRVASNDPPLVQFNSWYPFPGTLTVDEMKRCADVARALGVEVFVLDSGWYSKKDWSRELGDYQVEPTKFPHGIEELAAHVHAAGMKFGLWVEIENVGVESRIFREHPGWLLHDNGAPIRKGDRYQLNFAMPEVRAWASATLDRLVRDYKLDWVKIDYNIDIGADFDPRGAGDTLYRHVTSYYRWLDELRARHPNLIVENCSSGGLRFDLGIMAHAHTTWLSDMVEPIASLQLGYGCTVEFAPEVCNHWMVGDKGDGDVELKADPGWWDFMFRVPMNGQFGISSRVFAWSPELKERAAANVALYKRIRRTIADADVYHLTPPPPHSNPEDWMAIQYATPGRSVLMAYRLAKSEAKQSFKLRGLEPGRTYRATVGGRELGVFTGKSLLSEGFPVALESEWRAAVIELEAQ
ncbi:MAG: alpha-galactosidase [Acidobacteriota bacterium]